jgi:alpha-glucoside transport system substrate-binding protein
MTASMRRRGAAILVGGVAASMLLAACGGSSTTSESSSAAAPSASTAASVAASAAASASGGAVAAGCEAYAAYGGNEGTKVTLFTSVLPPEQQRYEDAWKPFEDCTGIDIVYEGSDQFEAQLPTRIAGGNAPDLAWIPQPGLLAKLVQAGGPVAAPQGVADNVDKYFNPAWKTYGSVDGTFYGAPNSSNMKSFVWYSPKVFAEKGYAVPTTWDEMFALSDQMVADGIKPWCGGIESGGATGWPATDWLEQIVPASSVATYGQWVAHTVLSPPDQPGDGHLAGWMKNPDYVNGGFGNVDHRDHGLPGCRQADPTASAPCPAGLVLHCPGGVLKPVQLLLRTTCSFYLPQIDEQWQRTRSSWPRVHHGVLDVPRSGRADVPVLT